MKTQKKVARAVRPKHFSVPRGSRAQAHQNMNQTCSPSSVNGHGSYGGATVATNPDKDYLTFVVQRHDGQWTYVRVNQHCLDCYNSPCVFGVEEAENLLDIWKRVVIDNAIPWEDSVRPETLRIVSYKMQVEDLTLSLFHDDQAVNEFLRMSAMSKLSEAEARLLGLTHAKAKQMFVHNPEFHRDDQKTLTDLTKVSATLPLDTMMSHLNG
jgi:hypothetical protein